jgi:hypothetical protein
MLKEREEKESHLNILSNKFYEKEEENKIK